MLLGQLHKHAVENLLGGSLQGGIQNTITVHNDEAELFVVLKQTTEGLHEEGVLAAVGKSVDLLEGLNVNHNLFLGLAVTHLNHTAENDEAIGRHILVQLQLFLG